jgi:hypothetical protein
MQYTLEELAAAVGCAAYPQRWNDFYAEVMADYDANGCRYSAPAFYDRLEQKYDCFGEKYGPIYREAAQKTAAIEPLDRFLALMARAVQDADKKDADIRGTSMLKAPDGADPLAYNMLFGLVACSQLDTAAENMRRRGIPEAILRDTLRLVIGCESSYERRHGGQHGYDILWWAQLHVDGKLYRIGRLELELLEELPFPILVLRHKGGSVVTLADGEQVHRDGYVLGSLHYEDAAGAWEARVEETADAWTGYSYLENGYISIPYMGIQITTATDGIGIYVYSVEANSPAASAGLRKGDIIVGLGDHATPTLASLDKALRNFEPNDTTSLQIYRNRQILDLTITFGAKSPSTT